jgi:SET domain-containing protein
MLKNKHLIIASPNPALYIAASPIHGRGVYANKTIKPGEIIESCPVIKMKLEELSVRKFMVLNYYAFMIDEQSEYTGIALGYGSLYNHADNCNAGYYYDHKNELMIFEALRKITKHEEITINYIDPESTEKTIEEWSQKPEI